MLGIEDLNIDLSECRYKVCLLLKIKIIFVGKHVFVKAILFIEERDTVGLRCSVFISQIYKYKEKYGKEDAKVIPHYSI